MVTQTVLLADDDPISRAVVEELLTNDGYTVFEAETGEQALELLEEESVDVVLLDMVMPGIDGLETCRRFRRRTSFQNIPVIIVTALEEIDLIASAFEAGATDFFIKPLRGPILINRLRLILEHAKTLRSLAENNQLQAQAQTLTGSGHWDWDIRGNQIELSPALTVLLELGDAEAEISLARFYEMIPAEQREAVRKAFERAREHATFDMEHDIVLASKRTIVVRQTAAPSVLADDTGARVIGTLQDITSLRKAERRVLQLREHDLLTGLPNRASTLGFIDNLVSQSLRYDRLAALLVVDINRFSLIDETYGQAVADKLLAAAAHRMQLVVRGGQQLGTVGRLGDDRFAILLDELSAVGDSARVATRLHADFESGFDVDDMHIELGVRIGIASIPDDGHSADVLLSKSESATRSAKETGSPIAYFTEEMTRNSAAFLSLEKDLRDAVRHNQFFMVYQPLVQTEGQRVIGAEALIRWQHPRRGLVSPADFIPVAERTHLMIDIGQWVVGEACRNAAELVAKLGDSFRVSINISAKQLHNENFITSVSESIEQAGVLAETIELELTESAIVNISDETAEVLTTLRDKGVSIALDDFGTGYSSLHHLKRLPIDTIKVDRSFVKDIPGDHDGEAISEAILALANSMGLRVVAEGIETESQLRFFEERGCDLLQGYYFSKPREMADFVSWFHSAKPH